MKRFSAWSGAAAVFALLVLTSAGIAYFKPNALSSLPGIATNTPSTPDGQAHDEHFEGDGHDHGHDHAESSTASVAADTIQLSSAARENLRLEMRPATVEPFTEYIEVPGTVSRWPGRTHISVASPLTGVIKAINVARGEIVGGGVPLFTLRLTHQDLVRSQQEFLAKLGQLDVERREIERLTEIAGSGAVAGKTLINRQYERDRLLADIEAARQSMLLHGLTSEQVVTIENSRQLVHEVVVRVPRVHADRSLHHDSGEDSHLWQETVNDGSANVIPDQEASNHGIRSRLVALRQPPPEHPLHSDAEFLVTELDVSLGESVEAGQQLARLSDYSHLLIEGHAYQQDSEALRAAADSGTAIQAVIDTSGDDQQILDGLRIIYIGNEVETRSRTLPFYVELVNAMEREEERDGHRYASWRYKPGQRLKLRLPVAERGDAIVVPRRALIEEAGESYVFVRRGTSNYQRREVRVVGRDTLNVALANDGTIRPGQPIVIRGASQLNMALRNREGGAVDPHAGHNH